MDMILTKITHSIDSNKRDSYIYAVTLMGLFTFLFLGVEYFFVNVLSHIVSEDQTVLAQNYALGVSAAGFVLYALFEHFCKDRLKEVCFMYGFHLYGNDLYGCFFCWTCSVFTSWANWQCCFLYFYV